MFHLSSFAPTQNPNLRYSPTKPQQNNASQPFVPMQSIWDGPTFSNQGTQENFGKDDMPYNIQVLLANDRDASPASSSGSEETDVMPDFAHKAQLAQATKEWDFGQGELGRRKSDVISPNNPMLQTALYNFEQSQNAKVWAPLTNGKVNVKPSFFSPLNTTDFNQTEKKAYFVTIEGYNQANSKKFFKIEKLCYSLQGSSAYGGKDTKPFLYLSLWNDLQNQEDMENVFEPWIYAINNLHFRMVIKVHMSHSNEDPFTFDFPVDLRQFALPTQDKRTQGLEINYSEQVSSTSPGMTALPNNNITLHVQVTNEKLVLPQGFRKSQDQNTSQSDYSVIFRQIFLGLPLTRSNNSSQSLQIPHFLNKNHHDIHGKRGSAIALGEQQKLKIEAPQSPLSWSMGSGESSPSNNKFIFPSQTSQQLEPTMPPGILSSNDVFKFNNRQQRHSIQPVKRDPTDKPVISKFMRMQTSDLSNLGGERNSDHVAFDTSFKSVRTGSRKESIGSESTSGTNFSVIGKFQNQTQNILTNQPETQEVIQAEEPSPTIVNTSNTEIGDEFKIDAYIGRIADYAKTYQGSKVLQKYVTTANKDDLDIVAKEIGQKIGELMLDPYANYMVQTLVQNGNPRQRTYLLQKIAPSFTAIARDKKGTHSLQAIVALIDSPDEYALMRSIVGPYVFELSMDPRANYVIQKLINIIPPESSSFIYQPIFDNFVQIANNSFGLLVLKQMMARVEQKDSLKMRIVELTCLNFEKLIQNPYGNYAIQHIVEYYHKDSLMIMNKILTKIIPYSSQKISSNVIEKCLIVCDSLFRRRVVEEILSNGRLGDLMKNKYGNFVTLQLLAVACPADKKKLMREIFRCANAFNGTKYKTRWLKFAQENPMKVNWNKTSGDDSADDEEGQTPQVDEEKLEAVKNIWREMTKEEKNEGPSNSFYPSQNKQQPVKKYSHRRDDSYGY